MVYTGNKINSKTRSGFTIKCESLVPSGFYLDLPLGLSSPLVSVTLRMQRLMLSSGKRPNNFLSITQLIDV
jgi:hypothetical protein